MLAPFWLGSPLQRLERLQFQKVGRWQVGFTNCNLVANTEKKEIHHQRIYHVLGNDQYVLDETTSYPSIEELLFKEREKLQLLRPCLGSPFTSLVVQEVIEGYVGS